MKDYIYKLEKSVEVMNSLAFGINPFNQSLELDEKVLNSEKLSKCFLFVKGALEDLVKLKEEEKIKEKKNIIRQKRRERNKFPFVIEENEKAKLREVFSSEENMYISQIAKIINKTTNEKRCRAITGTTLNQGLFKLGLLEKRFDNDNKSYKYPSNKGFSMDINPVERISKRGKKFNTVVFGEKSINFIIDNLEKIIDNKDDK